MPPPPPHPPRYALSKHHLLILALGCLLVYGNYHCYDLPAALNLPLRTLLGSHYGHFQWQLNLLYTVYSAPNVLMPLLGGIVYDRLGPNTMLVAFSALVVLGALLFWIGIVVKSFPLLVLARIFAGIGGESLEVAGTAITTVWFHDAGYLSFALGINLSISRIAAAVQDAVTPFIVSNVVASSGVLSGPALAALLGLLVCTLSILATYGLILADTPKARFKAGISSETFIEFPSPHSAVTRDLDPYSTDGPMSTLHGSDNPCLLHADSDHTLFVSHDSKPRPVCSRRPRSFTADNHRRSSLTHFDVNHAEMDISPHETVPLLATSPCFNKKESGFGLSFSLLCALAVFLYGSVMPFIHISSDFIQSKWYPGNLTKAGQMMAIPDLLCAILTPLIGLIVDKYGYPAMYLPLSGILLVLSHSLLFFSPLPPGIGLFVMGVGSSVFAATLWPCVPVLVADKYLGTAYGAVTVALNLGLACIPMVVAAINGGVSWLGEGKDHWVHVGGLFVVLSLLATVLAVAILAHDAISGSWLLVWESWSLPMTLNSEMTIEEHVVVTVLDMVHNANSPIRDCDTMHHRTRHLRSTTESTSSMVDGEDDSVTLIT